MSAHDVPVLVKIHRRWPILGPALLMFMVPYGCIQLIRIVIEWPIEHRPPYQTASKAYRWGDRIAFPLFGGLAGLFLSNYRSQNRWFDRRIISIGIAIGSGLIGIANWILVLITGHLPSDRKFAPSEIAHNILLGIIAAAIAHTVLSFLLGTKEAVWKKALLVGSLAPWLLGAIADLKSELKK